MNIEDIYGFLNDEPRTHSKIWRLFEPNPAWSVELNPRTEAAAILDSGLELGDLNFVATKKNGNRSHNGLRY